MISIAIPVYAMQGKGVEMLTRCLDSIKSQSYKDYEIVVADNSEDNELVKLCQIYGVVYIRNPNKGITKNTNCAIKHCKGEWIKILNQDDYFTHENALKDIVDNLKGQWLITGCDNNLNPYYTGDIHQGNNKLGGPSALTIKNEHPMLFDEDMTWLFDCDYYKRMYIMYGEPVILKGNYVTIGVGEHQVTSTLLKETKEAEVMFMTNKYARL